MSLLLIRITSYNVCYTKLLRPREEFGRIHGVDERIPLAGIGDMVRVVSALRFLWYPLTHHIASGRELGTLQAHVGWSMYRFGLAYVFYLAIVITSYSIHYTKLYDSRKSRGRLIGGIEVNVTIRDSLNRPIRRKGSVKLGG